VSLNHPLTSVPNRFIVHWRHGPHNGIESWPVSICGPYFEPIVWMSTKRCRVDDERLNAQRRRFDLSFFELSVQCVEQQLQCRQSLLTIDNRALLHRSGRVLYLLQYDSAQKVGVMCCKWFA
jgi:hypothetical protein